VNRSAEPRARAEDILPYVGNKIICDSERSCGMQRKIHLLKEIKISILLFSLLFVAQNVKSNPIDTIQTLRQALAFAKKYPQRASAIDTTWTSSFTDSLGEKRWCKADIDGNGLTDMLLVCTESEIFSRFGKAFMAFSDTVKEYNLDIALQTYPVISSCQGQPIIILYKHVYNDTVPPDIPLTSILVCDTIVFRNGLFVKFNKHPIVKEFDSITMVTEPEMELPDFKLIISSKGNAFLTPITYSKHKRPTASPYYGYRRKISPQKLAELSDILSYIDFHNLDTASNKHTEYDHHPLVFNIKLKNGTELKINDRRGYSYATKPLIKFFNDLHNDPNWVRIKTK
jgi:hypothetical protein